MGTELDVGAVVVTVPEAWVVAVTVPWIGFVAEPWVELVIELQVVVRFGPAILVVVVIQP